MTAISAHAFNPLEIKDFNFGFRANFQKND